MAKIQKTLGRKNGSTEIAVIDIQQQAIDLFQSGASVEQIAKKLKRSRVSIYYYIRDARFKLIEQKKDHFNQSVALHLDDAFQSLSAQSKLLSDEEFLRTADAERIDSIARSYGIISDKCIVLLAGLRHLRTDSAVVQTEQSS